MNFLGIDWGERKIGVAWASGSLAQPLEVIRYIHTNKLFKKLKEIIIQYKIEKIIVGISEGPSAVAAINFAKALENEMGLPVETFDETLTSADAQALAMQGGLKQKKRKEMEDAFAASIMLQSYLDSF